MTQQHPIAPPPELFKQWEGQPRSIAFEAAYRAGADTELDACCEVLRQKGVPAWSMLRIARRPKPPSLREEALALLNDWCEQENGPGESIICNGLHVLTIRRALEALPND